MAREICPREPAEVPDNLDEPVLQPHPELVVVVGVHCTVQPQPGQRGANVHPEPGPMPHPRLVRYGVAEVAGGGEPRHSDDQQRVAGLSAVAERAVAGEPVIVPQPWQGELWQTL